MKVCPACGHDNLPGAEECDSCQEPLSQLDLPQAGKGMQKKILEGTVSDLPRHDGYSVSPKDNVAQVLAKMRQHRIGCVLVLDGKRLVGILTERDLLFKVADQADPLKYVVKDIMKPNPDTLRETDLVNLAFHKMAVGGFRHLPVEKSDGTYAIVSARDLMAYLCR